MRLLFLAITILSLCSAHAVCAPFKVPPDVYNVARLEEAKLEAQKSAKPLGFLQSDPESESDAEDTVTMLRELRAKVVLVFVASGTGDWNKLPPEVKQALASPAAGRYIPRTVVFSPDLKTLIASVPYRGNETERRRVVREAEKLIAEATVKMQQERKSFDSIFKK